MRKKREPTGRDQGARDSSGRFRPGWSGNSAGRPPGRRNEASLLAAQLLAEEAEALVRRGLAMALEGDPGMMRFLLSRLLPAQRELPVMGVELPKVADLEDATKAAGTILEAVAEGRLTPGEGQAVGNVLENLRKSLETQELESRLAALEEEAGRGDV